jgi:asparagine synthase (glutamine-hydrolysing)
MYRYLALAWDPGNRPADATARHIAERTSRIENDWALIVNTDGLMVYHAGRRPESSDACEINSDQGIGVILGTLFCNSTETTAGSRVRVLAKEVMREIIGSQGRVLVTRYWGRYVAFLHDKSTRSISVLRGPTGALPCFTSIVEGVRVFFSCLEDCIALGLIRYSVNWQYIRTLVAHPFPHSRDTGLKEVSEVGAGECWHIRGHKETQRFLYWDPTEIALSNPVERVDNAVEELRRTTQMCIWTWASCYPSILHMLSGGLDSSIVFRCLLRAPNQPAISCLNYHDPQSSASDEREFARAVTDGSGCRLIEAEELGSEISFEDFFRLSKTARPGAGQYYVRHSRLEGRIATEKGALAIFQGAGGDQVFFQNPLFLALVDCLQKYGFGWTTLRVAQDLARVQQLSLWAILTAALRLKMMRTPSASRITATRDPRSLVSADVIEDARRNEALMHSGNRDVNVPSGKLKHISMMSVSHDFYDPLGTPNSPERVRPLVSQPLIELCLRIPTYILSAGGWDRAVTRRAFEHELPQSVALRISKGTIDRVLQRLLMRNLRFARELLLDGIMVRERLLDRQKIERALNAVEPPHLREAGEIVAFHLETEIWLRSWTSPLDTAALDARPLATAL